ncbi:helix-turn-helix transcriptional regulator [Mucilaginibacter sp. CAU 1740]|uniref:helix-turn-helix transcriptional regulator n=1 Tax=Mucilaginibacter sp. CAU 1740 TaxID=3140365 RepID=UPI00325BE7C7
MTTTAERPNQVHHGRNVKRFREMLGLKQEALALELGDDWSQRRISLLEAKEVIEPELLSKVAQALRVPEEAIKNFDEEKAIYNIQNNYEGANAGSGALGQYQNYHDCTFNPIEKWLEVLDENKKLYERLLNSEREKVEILKHALTDFAKR